MEGACRAVAVADLLEVPKQQEDTTATAVATAAELEEVPVPKQEDTTATAVSTADLKEVPKQEDTTSSGAADDEEKEAAGMKRKLAKTGFKSPYDSDYDDDEPYEYNSGDDMEDDNKESFIEKEAQKIREKGKATYFMRGMFRCPYCTTKPKPRDGIYEHLMSHARDLSWSADQDIKTRAEHAALLKALGCYGCFYFASLMLWQDVMVDWIPQSRGAEKKKGTTKNKRDDNARFSEYELRKQVLDHELDCKTHEHNVKTFMPTWNSYNTTQLGSDLGTIIKDIKALA
ncbi:lrr receptor-like serine threonine-protein kinase [Hordeum vulgare]|nr:lrr receptor-like serine threonine-protein kinase [Hordeum vulgare]